MATYYGTAGNDYIGPYTGVNTIYGGAGNDIIEGYTDADRLEGESGNDTIWGWFGDDTILGGDGDDALFGEDNNDYISGGNGNDVIYGGNNADTLLGGSGNDYIVGDYDPWGEIGQDVMYGGPGNDTLQGGGDNDFYGYTFNSDGQDHIYDSAGDYDTLRVNGLTLGQIGVTRYGDDVFVYARSDASDGVLDEYVRVYNYFSGSSYAEGKIEFLNVNGSNYTFDSYISNDWQFA